MGTKIAKSTVSTHASALKRILDTALVKGWITNASLPTANVSTKDGDRRATFELDEYNTMRIKLRAYKNKDTHRKRDKSIRELLYDYVLFLANSGVRHGKEALRLTWKDIGTRTIGNNTSFSRSKERPSTTFMSALHGASSNRCSEGVTEAHGLRWSVRVKS